MTKRCILITNVQLDHRTGTETFTRDLALALHLAGHFPMVYSSRLGEIASEIAAAGIPVVDDLLRLPETPDLIHGHHHVETMQALIHFPRVPGIFVCHDRVQLTDVAPRFNHIERYVAVDYNCRQRLIDDQVPEALIRVIYNTVDTDRFKPRPPLPNRPHRTLVFSNAAKANSQLGSIQAACAKIGLSLDVIGEGVGQSAAHPEEILGNYDLVFAKARAAMEAMAVGAAVILCDVRGLGSLVTAADVAQMQPWNFGMRLLKYPLEPTSIIREIDRYNADDAAQVSQFIRTRANLRLAVQSYLDLYEEVLQVASLSSELINDLAHYLRATLARIPIMPVEFGTTDREMVESVALDFKDPLAGGGWALPGEAARWMLNTTATLKLWLSPKQAYRLIFKVRSLSLDTLNSLVLTVNNQRGVPLIRHEESDGSFLFEGTLPQTLIASSPTQTQLNFSIDQLSSPRDLGLNDDPRSLGLAFHWLRIEPEPSGGDPTPTEILPSA